MAQCNICRVFPPVQCSFCKISPKPVSILLMAFTAHNFSLGFLSYNIKSKAQNVSLLWPDMIILMLMARYVSLICFWKEGLYFRLQFLLPTRKFCRRPMIHGINKCDIKINTGNTYIILLPGKNTH